jgi:hypothetical protein
MWTVAVHTIPGDVQLEGACCAHMPQAHYCHDYCLRALKIDGDQNLGMSPYHVRMYVLVRERGRRSEESITSRFLQPLSSQNFFHGPDAQW